MEGSGKVPRGTDSLTKVKKNWRDRELVEVRLMKRILGRETKV